MAEQKVTATVHDLRRRLERYATDGADPKKIVKVLHHLSSLTISINCLKETGIGLVVNSLRHEEGETGPLAKDLVKRWKAVSSAAAPSSSQTSLADSAPLSLSRDNHVESSAKKRPYPTATVPGLPPKNMQKVIDLLPNLDEDPSIMELLSTHESSMISSSSSTQSHPVVDVEDANPFKKARRSQVFSGRARARCFAEVPKLQFLCTRVLLDHVNEIEDMGPVPYLIIKPVLEACTPAQLTRIEMYNQQLVDDEDSDELWAKHCSRDFRGVETDMEEGETFREFYARKLNEREQRLQQLKQSIESKNRERNAPVRTTQMATFENSRIIRGRPQALDSSSASSSSGGIRAAIKAMVVPAAPGKRGKPSFKAGIFGVAPPPKKTAPLMKKVMQDFKNRSKR